MTLNAASSTRSVCRHPLGPGRSFHRGRPATVVLDVESSLTYTFASRRSAAAANRRQPPTGIPRTHPHPRSASHTCQARARSCTAPSSGSIRSANMLKQIGGIYKNLLGADSIVFYYRHSYSSPLNMRTPIGDFLTDHCYGHPALRTRQPDHRTDGSPDCPFSTRKRKQMLPGSPPSLPPLAFQGKTFRVARVNSVSCAAIPLVVAQESIGLMWINYRRHEPLTRPYAT